MPREVDVQRIVPDLTCRSVPESTRFYAEVLGLEVAMDHGWIATVSAPGAPSAQLTLMSHDATAPMPPAVSVEVTDVDAAYATALAHGVEIVHPLTDEPWGVRRFFLRDPDGHVVNVLGHA